MLQLGFSFLSSYLFWYFHTFNTSFVVAYAHCKSFTGSWLLGNSLLDKSDLLHPG